MLLTLARDISHVTCHKLHVTNYKVTQQCLCWLQPSSTLQLLRDMLCELKKIQFHTNVWIINEIFIRSVPNKCSFVPKMWAQRNMYDTRHLSDHVWVIWITLKRFHPNRDVSPHFVSFFMNLGSRIQTYRTIITFLMSQPWRWSPLSSVTNPTSHLSLEK